VIISRISTLANPPQLLFSDLRVNVAVVDATKWVMIGVAARKWSETTKANVIGRRRGLRLRLMLRLSARENPSSSPGGDGGVSL
jgi:hypothetical protein